MYLLFQVLHHIVRLNRLFGEAVVVPPCDQGGDRGHADSHKLLHGNVGEAFLQAPTAAWGNLWDCRAALRKLVSSVYLENDLNLPFGKSGKFLFQLGYTPVVSDMKKIIQKTAALSFLQWALAVWDMDTATLYMVKYDRSH